MQKTALKFIWNYLKKFRYTLLLIVFLSLVARSFSQIGAYYMAKIFDFAAGNKVSVEYWSYNAV